MPKIRDWTREDPAKAFKRERPVEQDRDQGSVASGNLKVGTESGGMEWSLASNSAESVTKLTTEKWLLALAIQM